VLVRKINTEEGISIFLVEQNANIALDYSGRTYVLEAGRGIMEGPTPDVKKSPTVVEAYIGFDVLE
jgi:branched-chain amino acid transport system ATP-binding protein